MTAAALGYFCGQFFVYCLVAFGISRLFKDKAKRLPAFIISLVILFLTAYNSTLRELNRGQNNRVYNSYQASTPKTYKADLDQDKSIKLTTYNNKVHISRSEGANAQQVFLDNCKLSTVEQEVYKNNAEFQKAFMVVFAIDSTYRMLRGLSKICNGVDILDTRNYNKLKFDKELENYKTIFVKHMGQTQYNCFEEHVLEDFGSKVAPTAAGALYSQLRNMAAGRAAPCSLLADRKFQMEMYTGLADTLNKVIGNDDPMIWNALFNQEGPESNEFDIKFEKDKAYIE